MRSSGDFYVFPKWKDAPAFAFGSQTKVSLVPDEDKRAYTSIFNEMVNAAEKARLAFDSQIPLILKSTGYSPSFGSRGHRPVDLWVSVCGADSEAFGKMPQVYVIASDRGLEIGFAVSIDEADYHDPNVKARNRLTVPLLNAKLPSPQEPLTSSLDQLLSEQGGWHFNTKTRLMPGETGWDEFRSLAEMLDTLKRGGAVTGGGAICRTIEFANLPSLDLEGELTNALRLFLPLIARCLPTSWDVQVVQAGEVVAGFEETEPFDPASATDGRKKVLAAVARRQGQAGFRKKLMTAYNGRCAITGTAVSAVLQAAHISPYLGPETNHVTNGLLLRADIHSLFDLRLLKVDPDTLTVAVSGALKGTQYEALEGTSLAPTLRQAERPSEAALRKHFEDPET